MVSGDIDLWFAFPGLAGDEATGGLTATGSTPGLYGGSRDEAVCDVPALTELLTDPANATRAEAFAGALGLTVADLGAGFLPARKPGKLPAQTRRARRGGPVESEPTVPTG